MYFAHILGSFLMSTEYYPVSFTNICQTFWIVAYTVLKDMYFISSQCCADSWAMGPNSPRTEAKVNILFGPAMHTMFMRNDEALK